MITDFRKRSRKLFAWSAVLFVALFTFRLIYGYMRPEQTTNQSYNENYFDRQSDVKKNYASEKYYDKAVTKSDVPAPMKPSSSQKFEKTASMRSKSTAFDEDEKKIKQKTKDFNAIIQYEQNTGQKGNRQMHIVIGVDPALFDSFYVAIKQVGTVKAVEVTKVDKTNEYNKLNAQKLSLEKNLASLNELKAKGGQIADFVALHDKILELEERLQNLGVELGNFDSEHEFCTVKLSLYEGAAERGISMAHRIKVAFEWAVTWFSVIVFTTLGLSAAIYIALMIRDKAKV